jgi:hypothetical protein
VDGVFTWLSAKRQLHRGLRVFKTYETARELIDCLVDFHYRAALFAETGMDMEQEERVSLVFHYLYDHHQQMQETLATYYEEEGEESVLNASLPFELDASSAPEEFITGLECGENISFEDVTNIAKSMADYVTLLLDDISAEAGDPQVQEAFTSLLEMEEEELKLLIRGINSLRDY